MTRLLLAGATGLIGRAVLQLALDDPRVTRVVAPARRALPAHDKLEAPIVTGPWPDDAAWWTVDAVICTLGTTLAAAGSREAFRRVDLDLVVAVAHGARRHGARAFALTSAMGADPRSAVFYSRTKGEAEAAVRACGYPSLTIVRPGLLGGVRQESRPGEALAKTVTGWLGPLLPRSLRMVDPGRLARELLEAALRAKPGEHVVSSAALQD